jgi:hypothetical protein
MNFGETTGFTGENAAFGNSLIAFEGLAGV